MNLPSGKPFLGGGVWYLALTMFVFLWPSRASCGVISWGSEQELRDVPQPPSGLTNVKVLTPYAALLTNGTVVAWYDGLKPPVWATNITSIAASWNRVFAVRADGMVLAWGEGGIAPPTGLSNVVAVSAGVRYLSWEGHVLALTTGGRVVGWGDNGAGQLSFLPDNTNIAVAVAGGSSSWLISSNGAVRAYGVFSYNNRPVFVPPGLPPIATLAVGHGHVLALLRSGEVVAWGVDNFSGQATVPPGLSNVVSVAAAESDSLALLADGSVVGWGRSRPPLMTGVSALSMDYPEFSVIRMAYGPNAGHAPILDIARRHQSAKPGSPFEISATVKTDGSPFTLQWCFDGFPIPEATNISLQIPVVKESDRGTYSLIGSNWVGANPPVSIKLLVAPANDDFRNANALPAIGGRFYGNLDDATVEYFEPPHAGRIRDSVWFAWTAPMNVDVTMDTIGSLVDTALAVYTGSSLGNLSLVAADDDGGVFNYASMLSFPAVVGQTYYIAVADAQVYEHVGFDFVLNVHTSQPVVNVTRSAAQMFSFQVGSRPGGSVLLEASPDLINWTPVVTNAVPENGVLSYVDEQPKSARQRFFRAKLQ